MYVGSGSQGCRSSFQQNLLRFSCWIAETIFAFLRAMERQGESAADEWWWTGWKMESWQRRERVGMIAFIQNMQRRSPLRISEKREPSDSALGCNRRHWEFDMCTNSQSHTDKRRWMNNEEEIDFWAWRAKLITFWQVVRKIPSYNLVESANTLNSAHF